MSLTKVTGPRRSTPVPFPVALLPEAAALRSSPAGAPRRTAPGFALLAPTASRSEQSASQTPSAVSAVLVTV